MNVKINQQKKIPSQSRNSKNHREKDRKKDEKIWDKMKRYGRRCNTYVFGASKKENRKKECNTNNYLSINQLKIFQIL